MQQLAITLAILAFGLGAIFILSTALSRRRIKREPVPALEPVPPALRPGDTDDVLETSRLTSIIKWGAGTFVFMAVVMAVYWLAEPSRMVSKEDVLLQQSIDRGAYYFALAADPETGEPPPRGTGRPAGLPYECARCHGVNAEGGENTFIDPNSGQQRTVPVPELKGVFARYELPPPGYRDARDYVRAVIEMGRTDGVLGVAADMPNWGNRFGGPLTDQTINDILNYLESIQEAAPLGEPGEVDGARIFANFCAVCHGAAGAGGSAPAFGGGTEGQQFPDIEDHIAFVKAGSRPGQPYGTSGLGTGGMPSWQGRLTEEEIRAVVEYERSL